MTNNNYYKIQSEKYSIERASKDLVRTKYKAGLVHCPDDNPNFFVTRSTNNLKRAYRDIKLSLSAAVRFLIERVIFFEERRKTREIICVNLEYALVLANGPSLSLMSAQTLLALKSAGTVVIGLNFYNKTHLKAVPPHFLVLTDPYFFSVTDQVSMDSDLLKLVDYMNSAQDTKIVVPFRFLTAARQIFSKNTVVGICDLEQPLFGGIDVLRPRSYCSITAYKALALGCHIASKRVLVLGVDNSGISGLSCSPSNQVYRVLEHSYDETPIVEWSKSPMGTTVFAYSRIFNDLSHFSSEYGEKIVNLDPFSLNDALPKLNADLTEQFFVDLGVQLDYCSPV